MMKTFFGRQFEEEKKVLNRRKSVQTRDPRGEASPEEKIGDTGGQRHGQIQKRKVFGAELLAARRVTSEENKKETET